MAAPRDEKSKPIADQGVFEEDDEFEEFPVEGASSFSRD